MQNPIRPEDHMSKLQVIVGSTRPTRSADLVAPWVAARASAHGGFDVEVIDLRDWPLPFFAEHRGTIGDFSDPTSALEAARAAGELIPGTFRAQAAVAAAQVAGDVETLGVKAGR